MRKTRANNVSRAQEKASRTEKRKGVGREGIKADGRRNVSRAQEKASRTEKKRGRKGRERKGRERKGR